MNPTDFFMNPIEKIARDPLFRAIKAEIDSSIPQLIEQTIAIQQVPAPTFDEALRAAFIQQRFEEIGLLDVIQDGLHNVYGRLPPATTPSTNPPVIISAHSDTVFPAETDLAVSRNGRLVQGPGIGDNSTGVAGMIFLAEALVRHQISVATDIWFVSNVGEEGLGDLVGMKAVVARFGAKATYIVLEGGLYGQISHQAIGVRRFRIGVQAIGGHSWGSFGNSSAIHILGRLIARIEKLDVPQRPKTTFNVGMIEGGTSINTIAQSAHMLLDLRSESPDALADLVATVQEMVDAIGVECAGDGSRPSVGTGRFSAVLSMEQIGYRPAGRIPRHTPLVRWAEAALQKVGCRSVAFITSSTDANVPLSEGITAVCIGLTESGNAHRLDEYMDPKLLPNGMTQLLLLTLAAAGFK